MKNLLRILVLLLGLGFFAYFVHQAGVMEIWRVISGIGYAGLLVLMPYLAVYGIDTVAWRTAFGPSGVPGVGWWSLVRVRWSGEAVSNVIPSAYVGGEAVKVYLLAKRGVDPSRAAVAAVTSKSCQTLAMVMFIAVGAVAALRHLPQESDVRGVFVGIAGLAFAGVAVLFWLQRHGLFSTALSLLRLLRIRLAMLEARAPALRKVDAQVRGFYLGQRRWFLASTTLYWFGWLADTVEIWLAAHLLGLPLDWTHAVALEAFISVAKAVGMFSPGSVGVQESGVVLLFHLFGLPRDVGIGYAILRRGREVVYAMIGWLLLSLEEGSLRELGNRVAKGSPEINLSEKRP